MPAGYAALLAAAGIDAPVEPARVIPLLIELSYSGPEGLRVTRLVREHAQSLRDRPPSALDGAAPLPLGPAFWRTRAGRTAPGELLWEILARRELASLYYGLLTMDDQTLAEVAADPALGEALARHAQLLPAHGRGIHIAGGQVRPAGGDVLADAWTGLVGESLVRPAAFVTALLSRDGGRLVHFYKTVAALSPSQVKFIAGPTPLSERERRARLERLYRAFAATLAREGEWLLPRGDAASLLFSLIVDTHGQLSGPVWTDFWKRAFEPGRWSDVADLAEAFHESGMLAPADVIATLCGAGSCDGRKVQTFIFLQRQFAGPVKADGASMLAAAWVRVRFPALALELERLRLDDPSAYFELGRAASALDELDGQARVISTVQFQSALVLLGHLRRAGAPAAFVRARLGELAALPLTPRGYDGALVRWLIAHVLAPKDGETADEALVRRLAGSDYRGPDERVEWEGLHYRVDLPATEARRIRAALGRFSANRLESALTTLPVHDSVQVGWGGHVQSLPSVRRLASRSPGAAADVLGADALAAFVYALALEDPENSIAVGPELPRRHVLVPPPADRGAFSPWSVPLEQRPGQGGRRIVGSLLALEAGVPTLAMRRLALGRPANQPRLSRDVIHGLLTATALTSVWTVATDAGGEAVHTGVSASPCLCLGPPSDRWSRLGLAREPLQSIELTAAPLRRVVEELSRRKMPLVLAPGVLRLLISDLVETAAVPHPDDVVGVLDRLRRIPASRFDDYIAAIAARGPLSAVDGEQAAARR